MIHTYVDTCCVLISPVCVCVRVCMYHGKKWKIKFNIAREAHRGSPLVKAFEKCQFCFRCKPHKYYFKKKIIFFYVIYMGKKKLYHIQTA
jgi:hypothetical protein